MSEIGPPGRPAPLPPEQIRRLDRQAAWQIPLFLLLILVTLPVTIPLAVISHRRTQRRRCAAAAATACVTCGAILGVDAIARADAAWSAHMERLFRDHPTVRFRVVRKLYAICGTCGARYDWDGDARAFVPMVEWGGRRALAAEAE